MISRRKSKECVKKSGESPEFAKTTRGQDQSMVYVVFGKVELLVQVFSYYQNIGVDKSHHHLMLINAPNHS